MKSQDPVTPSAIASADLQVAADVVDFERRTERWQGVSRAASVGALLFLVLIVVAVALFWRLPPDPAAAEARASGQQAALLEFMGTRDEGRTALWAYLKAGSDVVEVVEGTGGSRTPTTLASLERAGGQGDSALIARAQSFTPTSPLTGPAPEPLAFTQDGEDISVVVDGVTRHLSWTLWDEPCTPEQRRNSPIKATRQWRLCEGDGRCIEAPVLLNFCLSAPPALVALHRSGDVLWVIAERSFKTRNVPRMAAGGAMPELFAQNQK